MPDDLMQYQKKLDQALRGVVRSALIEAATDGLPGDHHFYITFRTKAPGVEISNVLHAQYEEEMTIVLQHQFWGLEVHDDWFTVTLSFNRVSEPLIIPFDAVSAFLDPAVSFGLQFDADKAANTQPAGVVTPVAEPDPAAGTAAETAPTDADKPEADEDRDEKGGSEKMGQVITLDSFRKP
ncbi:MAG: ClpXP protease specificity-enhancing factor SspB [Pseudomonadota bacterium]|nr:ClpXP protease specificity-enhancing factor SspB [Pseudomonadota bacterium]